MLCIYKNHQNGIVMSIKALFRIHFRKWLKDEQWNQCTHSTMNCRLPYCYYENMLKGIVFISHTKCKNREPKKKKCSKKSRQKSPFSLLYPFSYPFLESFSAFDFECCDLFEFLFVSFHIFHFRVQNSNRKRAELKITIALNCCDSECVSQCILNIFFNIRKMQRFVWCVFYIITTVQHIFSFFFSFNNNTSSDPIQIRFVWFCELFKCIHRMNKMLYYYAKGMNNGNVVRMVWRHDYNNVNGSFAGNKYIVPIWVKLNKNAFNWISSIKL